MPECAFCNRTAKMSGEHIWSEWMRSLFPGKRILFVRKDGSGSVMNAWFTPGIDQTAKVVCKPCNEGWMSNLESQHAKPAMADLILGNRNVVITPEQAQAIARFAFKTAVVVDHMHPTPPFFLKSVRRRFAKSLAIPRNVSIWFGRYQGVGTGRLSPYYHASQPNPDTSLQLYVCTYVVGHLFFQLVSADASRGFPSFKPDVRSFDHLSFQLWPKFPPGFVWPPSDSLPRASFDAFASRWKEIRVLGRIGPVTAP